jgi:multidrug resistance efflux pump
LFGQIQPFPCSWQGKSMSPISDPAVREGKESLTANGTASLSERVRGLRLPDKVDSPKAIRGQSTWLPWALCLMLAAASTSLAVQVYRAPATARPATGVNPANASADPAKTTAQNAEPAPQMPAGTLMVVSKGYVVPAHQIQVSPIDVSGRIQEIYFEEGKWVEQNYVLAKLDDESFRRDKEEAESALAAAVHRRDEITVSLPLEIDEAKAELQEAQFFLMQFERDYGRYKELGSKANIKELEQARFTYEAQTEKVNRLKAAFEVMKGESRRKRLQAADADVKQAEARLKKTEWRLRNCDIKAPISGNILTKKAEIGNLISPLSFNVSASLCDMADLTKLEADLEIQEREIRKVEVGQPCKLICDSYPDRTWDGKVIRIMPVALRAKTAIEVRVEILNIPKEEAGKFLRPDMGCTVSVYAK